MHLKEIDFRRNWLSQLFVALTGMMNDIDRRLEKGDYYDGTDAREDAEFILGIAFIAAQTYIVGTVADINAVLGKSKRSEQDGLLEARELLSLDVVSVANGVSRTQLVYEIANYHKHHDEWEEWSVNDRNRQTIKILNGCGIHKGTTHPCYEAAALLWPEEQLGECGYLLNLLEDWRERVFRKYGPEGNSYLLS